MHIYIYSEGERGIPSNKSQGFNNILEKTSRLETQKKEINAFRVNGFHSKENCSITNSLFIDLLTKSNNFITFLRRHPV